MRVIFRFIVVSFFLLGMVHSINAYALSIKDVQLYQQIFTAHKKGNYQTAKKLVTSLSNKLLMGYVLYDKYMSAKYRTTRQEIETWLQKYKDLPIASDIYALGQKKKIRLKVSKPKDVLYGGKSKACSYIRRDEAVDALLNKTFSYVPTAHRKKAQNTFSQLYRLIQNENFKEVDRLIDSDFFQETFTQTDIDSARTALAFSLFLKGDDDASLEQARKAIKTSGEQLPLAYWTAGLVSWRLEEYDDAASYFSVAATHDLNYPILRGSAAFWAARSYLKLGRYEQVGDYLELAAQQSRTFYGMLALRMLGESLAYVWDQLSESQDKVAVNFSHPALNRFYALKQIGKKEWANKELTKLYLESDKDNRKVLLSVSAHNGFQKDLMQLAGTFPEEDERFPIPNWQPQGRWKVDKALVFSFVRQESCFNKRAKSVVGASGLMQIMPQTGRAIARLLGMPWNANKMYNEAYNLALGQNYLLHLMEMPAINYNLIFTAVAYNAGPGNLIKWKKQMHYQDDPLLFIESIPSRETRSFVERIMVNYWVYRSLMNDSLNSLDEVIYGKWPLYRKNG